MRTYAVAATGLLAVGLAATTLGLGAGGDRAGATDRPGLTPMQQRLLSGTASVRLDALRAHQTLGAAAALDFRPTNVTGCPVNRGADVRVNRECQNLSDPDLAGRGQAQNETSIAQDPRHPRRLIASVNDYRRGDATCGGFVSNDAGSTWHDSTVPTSFTRGDAFGAARQYWEGGGDTSVAFDTKGNGYLSCLVFQRGGPPVTSNPDLSSAFYVFRTSAAAIAQGGASWTFPGRPVAEAPDVAGAGDTLLDKQLLTVDDHVGSPFQDRVYVTWTLFAPDGTAYIFGAFSSDHGESFSAPVLVSGDSPLCTQTFGVPTPNGRCNFNQFSQPFTGPDGTLYVAFANFNNDTAHIPGGEEGEGGEGLTAQEEGDNHNQMLLARSTDGGRTFSPPVKAGDFYDLPDCLTYQNDGAGSACVPEKAPTARSVFRATNYPVGSADPRDPDHVIVTFGSYINRHSNEANGCIPAGFSEETGLNRFEGVKEPGACNNDIVVSESTDGGQTFTGGSADVRTLPSTRPSDRATDQFWQWAEFTPTGRVAVAFYDRAYGDDERTAFSDFTVAGSRDAVTFRTARATTGSMPPPTQFEGQFFGDYSGMTARNRVHPFWMDTRDLGVFSCRDANGAVVQPPSTCTGPSPYADRANDQNVYTRTMPLPLP